MQLSKELLVKLKNSVSFFSSFSTAELVDLLKLAESESFDDKEVIFKEKMHGDKMYIIVSGMVRISKYLGRNQEEILVKLQSGACFGEMGVIDQSPRSATATVEGGPAVMLVLKESMLSENNVWLTYKLYKNFALMLAERLRETNNKLQEAAVSGKDFKAQMRELLKKKMAEGQTLKEANLKKADFSETFLYDANLSGAILVGAKFSGTKCKQANFTNSRFTNAKIKSVDFESADFRNADFTAANFENVTFSGCNLSGANFKGSDLTNAQLEALRRVMKGVNSDKKG